MHPVHHHLIEADLTELRPTQCTVGMAEVAAKRAEWARLGRHERSKLLRSHWFPAVRGAQGRHFVVDHHHLGVALWHEQVRTVQVTVLDDLSWLDEPTFWRTMEWRGWAHPFDARGARRPATRIPTRLDQLHDDPFRSLAGQVREAGGYAKQDLPYAEFMWADFLRRRLGARGLAAGLDAALPQALELAREPEARYLPGWSGRAVSAA
jgi:hypothetical protein